MSMFSQLHNALRKVTGKARSSQGLADTNASPSSRDANAAIEELSRAVQNDTDSVEIYLALGNLYRLRGDIDKAVHIRRCLIARPGLENSFRARAFLELGRDYRRGGFIDRAQSAFEQAVRTGADKETILLEMASLSGDSGTFDQAAAQFKRLGNSIAEAHYLTRHAEDLYDAGNIGAAQKTLNNAVKAYSGSIEAWIARISIHISSDDWKKANTSLREAMKHISLEKSFLLFDAIIALPKPDEKDAETFEQNRCDLALPVIQEQEPDLLLYYYAALFLLRCHNKEEASIWLAKSTILQPNFWAARYQILACSMEDEQLSPVFKGQLVAFMDQAKDAKRFVCQHCGLKREQAFYLCPRCRSWHSATFRTSLQD